MFEGDTDVDFGEEFTLDITKNNKNVTKKRLSEKSCDEIPKKLNALSLPKNIVKRKFPGPAGILPESLEKFNHNPEETPCSQMSVSVFQSSPWVDVSRDYEALVDSYNIKWIKINAELNRLHNGKAPFLAAIIKSIECQEGKNLAVKVVLRDVSGEIQGTILHSLYDEYSKGLVPGSVIVLRQCGVLSASYSNNHYLTITPKSLVRIYWKNDDEVVVTGTKEVSCENGIVKPEGKKESKENVASSSSQVRDKASQEEIQMWEEALEGLDMDSFLEDF